MQYQKLNLILTILMVIGSCSEKEEILNCEIAAKIIESDQYYRKKHNDILSPFFYLLDSLIKSNGYKEGMDDFSSLDHDLQTKFREEAKSIELTRPKPSQEVLDSIWNLQNKLDYENTKKLIGIIESMGLQAIDTLDFECGRKSFIVFLHTPEELKSEVKKLVDPDLKQIDEAQYNHIMWHLDGRNSN